MAVSRAKPRVFVALGLLIGVFVCVVGIEVFRSSSREGVESAPLQEQTGLDGVRSIQSVNSGAGNELSSALPSASEIEKLLNSTVRFERPLVLQNLLVDSEAETLATLLDESEHLGTTRVKNELQRAIVKVLASMNPRHSLDRIEQLNGVSTALLVSTLFEEWAILNLDEALEYASSLEDPKQNAALEGILRTGHDFSPHQILEIGDRVGNREVAGETLALKLIGESIGDPMQLWQLLVQEYSNMQGVSDLEIELLVHVADSYINQFGRKEIGEIASSISTGEVRSRVLARMFERIAEEDPERAFDLAAQVSDLEVEIFEQLIGKWAETDPAAALRATLETGERKGRLQRAAVKSWGSTNPNSLYEALDSIPRLLRPWARNHAIYAMARTAPDSAIERLEGIDDIGLKMSISRTVANYWPEQELERAYEWSRSNQKITSEMQKELKQIILERMARFDSEAALDLSFKQEIDESEIGLEAEVIIGVSLDSVESAIEMLNRARNQATRERAYPAIGLALVRKGRYDEARELVESASIQGQRDYYAAIADRWAEDDFEGLFNILDGLPEDRDLRMMVSSALASAKYSHKVPVTEEQKEVIMSHLPQAFEVYFD